MFAPRQPFELLLAGGRRLSLGRRTLVMGIVNVTPDSFADSGRHARPQAAIDAALDMEAAGADVVDIGGESTRPGAAPVSVVDELARVIPVVEGLAGRLGIPISIDTYKSVVAREALERGAALVNDISALRYDPALSGVVASHGAAVILMHNRGRSRDMYREARYDDVVREVGEELRARVAEAIAAGIPDDRIVLDPGLGFAKRAEQSGVLLAHTAALARLGRPLLVGPSRKSFLQRPLGECPPEARDWGTAAAVTGAVLAGAHIVRVHAVREMVDVVRVADQIRRDAGLDLVV